LAAFGVDLAVASEQCSWCTSFNLEADEITMTALTTRPLSDGATQGRRRGSPDDPLLRFAMRADATLCAGTGLLIAMAADPLSRFSGLRRCRSGWRRGAGAYGTTLYALAAAPGIRRIGVGIVIANVVRHRCHGGPSRRRAAADGGGRRHDARAIAPRSASPTPSTSECAVWRDSL
jgi:hypothetical protein